MIHWPLGELNSPGGIFWIMTQSTHFSGAQQVTLGLFQGVYCIRSSESGVFEDAQCICEIRMTLILLFIYLVFGYGSTNTEIIAEKEKDE